MSSLLLTRDTVGEFIEAVTVNGSFVVGDPVSLGRVVWLARVYARAVKAMVNHVVKGVPCDKAYKHVYGLLPDYVYLETACKNAKLIVEGLEASDGSKCEIESYWISSRGNRFDRGNRNVKLVPREDHFDVLIKYPWDRTWIEGLGGRGALGPTTPETPGARPARLREPISPRGTGPGLLWGRGSTSLLLIGILAPRAPRHILIVRQ